MHNLRNMDGPLVSIIMAAKDTEPYIRECLDSICHQTYANWELICVNDHSQDQTLQIMREYAAQDVRIKVIDATNHKLIPCLKEGYKEATGDLINRMDSDDRMPLEKLSLLVDKWLQYGKGYIIAGGTQHFVDEGEVGGGFRRYEEWLNEVARTSTHWQQIYRECVIPSHCWMLHRDDFEKAGGFEPEVYPEDYDLCFRFYREGLTVIGIDKILHFWRDRSNRISRTWAEYKDNRYFEMKLRYFYALDRNVKKPLVVWGAGRNGKDLVKLILEKESTIHWVCDNPQKIGKDIYGIRMESFEHITTLTNPQILVVVSMPDESRKIREQLKAWEKAIAEDYWFMM